MLPEARLRLALVQASADDDRGVLRRSRVSRAIRKMLLEPRRRREHQNAHVLIGPVGEDGCSSGPEVLELCCLLDFAIK
jgi:hypothetical protein